MPGSHVLYPGALEEALVKIESEDRMPSLTPASPKLSPTQTLVREEEEKHAMMMQHFFTQGSCTDCEVMKKTPFFIVIVRH